MTKRATAASEVDECLTKLIEKAEKKSLKEKEAAMFQKYIIVNQQKIFSEEELYELYEASQIDWNTYNKKSLQLCNKQSKDLTGKTITDYKLEILYNLQRRVQQIEYLD